MTFTNLRIGRTEDEDDLEDARDILSSAQKLLSFLPSVFSSAEDITALWHDDLSLNNILVDDHGAITAVVDWECVSALPIWMATRMPTFLAGGVREEKPKRDDYADEDEDENSGDSDGDGVDNEGKNELYWIHLMDYEVGKLQKVYNERLEKLWPARPQWRAILACR
ncbi:hypothetical protein B0H16DRAFT_1762283 [Mycena metata]|uniref:Aminoglycoside phosphotransferase domain-containing protein n=1 Tax=Mycena metata TaxID=1033252 RepID=A0AAD7HGG3_9AGAR|nr:hypothetical protein B0H16DRAFT_1336797 [Mycena metata]KAJ7737742.1 hypothetical protein B0H16DRAFT_1762283 [Mycena metata]